MDNQLLEQQLAALAFYGNRAKDSTHTIGKDWHVTVRSLPNAVFTYIVSLPDDGEKRFETVRFGICKWTGLRDADGQEIPFRESTDTIYGKAYPCVDRDLMDLLPPQIMDVLELLIARQSRLAVSEIQAVDFTAPSQPSGAGSTAGIAGGTASDASSATVTG